VHPSIRLAPALSGPSAPALPAEVALPPQAAEAGQSAPSILAVIVCYEPDRNALLPLVERLRASPGVRVLLVDNSELQSGRASTVAVGRSRGVSCVINSRNLGVAAAQNIGIAEALGQDSEFVLLVDQDSVPAEDMIDRLVGAYRRLVADGRRVAAVGPAFEDPRCGVAFPFARLRRLRMQTFVPRAGHAVECDLLISSGCLLSAAALREVGNMDEGLFIDYVDIEWCQRARVLGWQVFGVADARMHHSMGERAVRLFGRVIAIHSPVRHYYLMRNALLFARKPYLPSRWRLHLIYRVLGQFVLFGLLVPHRIERLHWMLLGVWDGARGVVGRLGGVDGLGAVRCSSPPRRHGAGPDGAGASGLSSLRD